MAKVLKFEPEDGPEDLRRVTRELGDDEDRKAVDRKGPVAIKAMLTPWMAGASYDELARLFELPSAASARQAIERALAEAAADTVGDRTMLVQKASMTLDMLQRSIMNKAIDANNPDQRGYIDTVLKIHDRKAALFGLNAPTTMLLATPGDDELHRYVAELAALSGVDVPVEADPFMEMVQGEDGEWRPKDE